jgi:neutral ceramidase
MFGGDLLSRFVNLAPTSVPVQLLRIGRLYLVGIPGEPTIVAGLRLRRTVAAIVGAEIRDVLAAGYSNDYIHYVTTPEEYEAQRYEGGSTLFGRWELPALQQAVAGLAEAMHEGYSVNPGTPPPERRRSRPAGETGESGAASSQSAGAPRSRSAPWPGKARRSPTVDEPWSGLDFGGVVRDPPATCSAGDRVRVEFIGAHPNNNLRRGGTYVELQHCAGPTDAGPDDAHKQWRTIADDRDWSTKFRWARVGRRTSRVTVTWDVPAGTEPGLYRLCYHGDARSAGGSLRPFTGVSPAIEVR